MTREVRVTQRAAGAVRAIVTGLVVGVVVGGLAAAGMTVSTEAAHAAGAGLTSSAVRLTNADNALNPEGAPFPDLEVTVSQTRDLVSQGIQVSWTGGEQSERPGGTTGGAKFLQIAQCWGEDPLHLGHPDRRTCQFGGTLGAGSVRDGNTGADDVASEDEAYTAFSSDPFSPTYTGIPFVAVNSEGIVDETLAPADRVLTNLTKDADGKTVQKRDEAFVDLNTNPFFTAFTTNEVKWAGSGADGSGSVPFEVQTNMQSTALGCGSPITLPDGSIEGQSCWLVIIPRGTGDSGSSQIDRSGLWWDAWEHHVAVKLEFKPLGVRCEIGSAERQLAGSELAAGAIASWQPSLCLGENGSPFVLSQGSEGDAVARAAGTTPSPLALTSRPLDPSRAKGTDPLVYAPVALAGIAISFSIDRQPHPVTASPEYKARAGLPMTDLKLTPRLLAKLLTASYVDSLPSGADKSHIGYKSYGSPGRNPRTILQDPEFLAINDPEWAAQIIVSASVADALAPSGRSDLAYRLWEYVLADRAARAWLAGAPDESGMIVNPYYSTNPDVNPNGAPLQLPTDTFPKADPIEKPDETVTNPADGTGAINLVTWRPFTSSFADGAYRVLRADGMLLGGWDRFATPPKFGKSTRELFGSQKVIGLTTTPAAALYQTVTAALRNPSGAYVLPTTESIAAATAAMTPVSTQPKVRQFAPTSAEAKAATTAYPLAMPVYAALNPAQTDAELRAVYANLIRFAANEGQKPGTDVGQLPPGYAPLPQSWVDEANAAADSIETGVAPPPSQASTTPTAAAPVRPATVTQTQPAPAPAPAAPAATGQPTGALAGAITEDDPDVGPVAVAIPAGVAGGLAAGLCVPLVSRIRRRI